MKNFLLSPLNKKIGLVALIMFFMGIIVNFSYNDFHNKRNHLGYMHKVEANPQSSIFERDITQTKAPEIQFLSVKELEDFLKEYEFERLYINSDPNFAEKVENLETYLKQRKSPLAEKAEFIVIMANKFEIDYRLLVAISIIESSGGRKLYRPYNAWGWGGSRGITFESWDHSLYVVSKGIRRGYYDRGATTPELMAPAYNPHTPNEWSAKVKGVMTQIGPEL